MLIVKENSKERQRVKTRCYTDKTRLHGLNQKTLAGGFCLGSNGF